MPHKLLAAALMPLDVVLLLGAVAFVLAARRRNRAALVVGGLAYLLLLAVSLPPLAIAITRPLESRYPPLAAAASPTADAIVVLGGCLAAAHPPRVGPELVDSSDRLLHAARLYRAGKAPLVVVTSGVVPWSGSARPESEAMALLLTEWGVPKEAILLESRSRTTQENAVETEKLLASRGARRILLVTSALHMPRAMAVFGKTDLTVVPAPTDFLVAESDPEARSPLGFIPTPSADALVKFQAALWERIGLVYYRLRGWTR